MIATIARNLAAYAREVGWRRALREWTRSLAWVLWHRTVNRWRDSRAVLAGYCNHRPWSPIPGEGGGYQHWRCDLRRRHEGLHRFRNYVWSDDGRTDYLPVPINQRTPAQPWDRHPTPTARQARAQRRWQEQRYTEIIAQATEESNHAD